MPLSEMTRTDIELGAALQAGMVREAEFMEGSPALRGGRGRRPWRKGWAVIITAYGALTAFAGSWRLRRFGQGDRRVARHRDHRRHAFDLRFFRGASAFHH